MPTWELNDAGMICVLTKCSFFNDHEPVTNKNQK
jgi:hypothetical protein